MSILNISENDKNLIKSWKLYYNLKFNKKNHTVSFGRLF